MLYCCFSVKAQNVGDTFSSSTSDFIITSISPEREVKLTRIFDRQTGSGHNTITYLGNEYKITSLGRRMYEFPSPSFYYMVFDNLKNMDEYAFEEAYIEHVDLSNSQLTVIPRSAFEDAHCSEIQLPNTITTIYDHAFCSVPIKSLNTPNVTYIDDDAFKGCYELENINLSKVTFIGEWAFASCTSLNDVALPQCLKTVGSCAFRYCSLTSLSLYNSLETFEHNYQCMAGNGTITMYIVSWDNKNALSGNTEIDLPIHYQYDNAAVTGNYILPNDITSLGEGALYHCYGLTAITLHSSLTQIGTKAFAKCTGLESITCNAATPPIVANANAFSEVDKSIPVTIPDNAGTYFSYTHATGWKDFTNYQVALQTIKSAAIIELNHAAHGNSSQTCKKSLPIIQPKSTPLKTRQQSRNSRKKALKLS